jgi:tetratricopeptide (TPR) repeat protein
VTKKSNVSILIVFSLVAAAPSEPVHATPIAPHGIERAPPASTPAAQQHQQGLGALAADELAKAEVAFKEAARLEPKSFAPLLGLADVALKRGNPKEAESWLQKARELAPQSPVVHTAWGRYFFSQKQYAKAEAAFKQAIAAAPGMFAPRVDLADLYMTGLSKPSEAVAAYRSALALEPNHAGAHHGLGMALAASGKPDEAIAEFEKAAQLAPSNPLPLQALGRLYLARGELDRALSAFDRALKVQPDLIPARVDRADILAMKGNASQAIAEYQAAANAAPRYAPAHLKLGMVYQQQQRWQEAETAYLAAIESEPRLAVAYNNLAWMSAERRTKLDEALKWAHKAVELAPQSPDMQDTLAWVYRARGRLDQAATTLEHAAKLPPKRAQVHYHLGVVYAEQGKPEKAVAALKAALAISPAFPDADAAKALLRKLGAS